METTFPRLLLQHAAQRPADAAMREKEYGIWQSHSWHAMAQLVERVACGLHQAGLTRGEHIVVVGANRPRLYATMLAAQSLGAVPIPLYQDAAATRNRSTNCWKRAPNAPSLPQSGTTTPADCATTANRGWVRWTP